MSLRQLNGVNRVGLRADRLAPPPAGYRAAVLSDVPLLYYRMNEASGAAMLDSSGASRDGVYAGSVTLGQPGLLTSSADLCALWGGAGYASTAHGAWMDTTTITLEAIVNRTTSGAYQSILDRDDGSASRIFQFRLNTANKLELIYWTSTAGPFTLTGATAMAVSTTYHVAATFDGAAAKLYVAGALDGSQATAGALKVGSVPLVVAANSSAGIGTAQRFHGRIDEPALYAGALSATRIAAHAAAA